MKRIKRLVIGILLVVALVSPFAAQAAVGSGSCYWWNWWLCSSPYYIVGPNG